MKKVRNWLLTLCCATACLLTHAENLSISPIGPVPLSSGSDTVFNITLVIKNNSGTIYNGQLGFASIIDTFHMYASNDTSGFGFVPAASDSIAAGDTIWKSVTVHVAAPRFKTGPTVVIIWPIRLNGDLVNAVDTFMFTYNVGQLMSVNKMEEEQAKVFIWDNMLRIQHLPEIGLKQVRIFDISGRQLLDYPNPPDNIPLSGNGTGIYIAEIVYSNNQRQVFRFYK